MSVLNGTNRTERYYNPAGAAERELDTVLNRFFGGDSVATENRVYSPHVDVREDGEHLIVEAELPGFKKDEVDITLEKQVLTLTAEKKVEKTEQPKEGKAGGYILRERRHTRFQRAFNLPETIDGQSVDAKLADGVLTITLNKKPETKPRKIQVS